MIKFDFNGVFRMKFPSYECEGGYLRLRCEKFIVDSRECKWVGKSDMLTAKVVFGDVSLEWRICVKNNKLKISVANIGRADVRIGAIDLIIEELIESRQYWQYVNHNPVVFECGVRTVALSKGLIKFDDRSDTVTVFKHKETGDSLLFGANAIAQATTSIELIPESKDWDSTFSVGVKFGFECLLKVGRSVSAPELSIMFGSNALELLEEYGKSWRRKFRNKRKDKIVGWNSWDYYAGAITEKDIIDNAREFKRITGVKDGYVILDDGWQVRWGDWQEANYYFPGGLKRVVAKIKALGLKAGIWISPYTAHAYSMIVRQHREALLKNEKGEFVIEQFSCGSVYVLDPLHPATKKYIAAVFGNLKRIGFEYFKIDFTFALEKGREFYGGKSLQEALRESVANIRKAIGENAYLMSGCYSVESAGGIVDGARVCADIHNFWGHVRRNAIEIAGKFWMGHIWNNDPDFLIVRSPRTSRDVYYNRAANANPAGNVWFGGRILDVDEVVTWASLVMLAGGDVILSDNLLTLNNAGRKIIRKVLDNVLAFPAYPIDLFSDEEIPSIWVGRTDKGYLVGIFNWTESHQDYEFDPSACDIKNITAIEDVWAGRRISLAENGTIVFTLKPHQCRVLKFVC